MALVGSLPPRFSPRKRKRKDSKVLTLPGAIQPTVRFSAFDFLFICFVPYLSEEWEGKLSPFSASWTTNFPLSLCLALSSLASLLGIFV